MFSLALYKVQSRVVAMKYFSVSVCSVREQQSDDGQVGCVSPLGYVAGGGREERRCAGRVVDEVGIRTVLQEELNGGELVVFDGFFECRLSHGK